MTRRVIPRSILNIWVARTSRMLEPEDQEALCGDLAESGVSGFDALCDVMDLVIRRQLGSLREVRPWLLLTLLAIPLGFLLSVISRETADGSAIYLWLYTDNWNLDLVRTPGYWRTLAECLPNVYLSGSALVCSSLAAGLLIGTVARRGRWLSTVGLISVLFCAGTLGVPRELSFVLTLGCARDYFGNAIVFTNTFYRAVYPQILALFFCVLPFIYGTNKGIQVRNLPHSGRFLMSIAFVASVGALVSQSSSWWFLHLWDKWPVDFLGLPSPMQMATIGSATYLLLNAVRSRNAVPRNSRA
jgi:hypothetical protein